MSTLGDITWKDWLFILIIFLLTIKLWQMEERCDRLERFESIEGLSNMSDEAVQDIAGVYNKENMSVSNLNITGNLTVNGESALKGKLTANNVPALTVGTLTSNGDALVKGNLTANGNLTASGSATFKKGVNISGKHTSDNTVLTVMDPGTKGNNSHFYFKGNDTYIGGGRSIITRVPGNTTNNKNATLMTTSKTTIPIMKPGTFPPKMIKRHIEYTSNFEVDKGQYTDK